MRRFIFPMIFVLFLCSAHLALAQKKAEVVVPDDYPTIEEAYANVEDGGVITIKPGKYELSETIGVDRNVTFQGDTENPEEVIIDCPTSNAFQITGGSPVFQNLTASSGAENRGGFYFTGGTPKLSGCVITSRKSTGIWVAGKDANPTVEKCVMKDCAWNGVWVYKEGRGKFSDCEIYGNELPGIFVSESGNPTVTGCKIHDGKASGVYVTKEGRGQFTDCEIYGNVAMGIVVAESGNPTVTGCKIHDGKTNGVLVYKEGRGEFADCEIYGNVAPGIAVAESGNPTVTGCKIHDGKQSGVWVLKGGRGEFTNCEIYGNAMPGIEVVDLGNPTVTGCNIHDNPKGGVKISNQGMGTFNNNTLDNLVDWNIADDAGKVKGSNNTPEIPEEVLSRPQTTAQESEETEDSSAETTLPASLEPGSVAGERKVLTVKGIEYAFRWCPAGEFVMGSPANEDERYSHAEIQHNVKLTRGFWMLETEVTQAMWQSVMGRNPSYSKGAQKPVENVSWDDCQEFCRKLSKKLGQKVQLPTEAQWEYACRAGTTTPFNFGNSLNGDNANCNGHFPYGTTTEGAFRENHTPVGSFAPNHWGLYDMHGNVSEWCSDYYAADYYSKSPESDPENTTDSSVRVNRGGNWADSAVLCRSAYRTGNRPDWRNNTLGLRVVIVPGQAE